MGEEARERRRGKFPQMKRFISLNNFSSAFIFWFFFKFHVIYFYLRENQVEYLNTQYSVGKIASNLLLIIC